MFGAGGQMGASVCRAVLNDDDCELSSALDPRLAGIDLGQATSILGTGLSILGERDALEPDKVDVAVDFTEAEASFENALFCARNSIHIVIGTTGLTSRQIEILKEAFSKSNSNCLIAPNFAIGAVLMMRFAELAAPLFETCEIIEFHHNRKADAPSGTALVTAGRIASAKDGGFARDVTSAELDGARGSRVDKNISIHSVRMAGMVAHQEVIFGTTGQTLSIRHDSYDRNSFMPGVLLAIKAISERDGLTIGIESILDDYLGLR